MIIRGLKMSNPSATPFFEEVREILKQLSISQKELSISQKELLASQKKTEEELLASRKKAEEELSASRKKVEEELSASRKRAEEEMREIRASQKKTDLQIQKIGGRFNERWGALVESLVEGKLVPLFQDQGIDITQTYTRSTGEWRKPDSPPQKREFDIIVANGAEAVVVEVKTVLAPKNVTHFIQTLKDFHNYLTRFKSEVIYGAVAYLKSENQAEVMAEKEGLFIIRATGDSARLVNQEDFKPKAFKKSLV